MFWTYLIKLLQLKPRDHEVGHHSLFVIYSKLMWFPASGNGLHLLQNCCVSLAAGTQFKVLWIFCWHCGMMFDSLLHKKEEKYILYKSILCAAGKECFQHHNHIDFGKTFISSARWRVITQSRQMLRYPSLLLKSGRAPVCPSFCSDSVAPKNHTACSMSMGL